MWQKDSLAVRLDIRLTRVRRRQCYSTLTGMELAVDLGTGPGQSLTVEERKEGMRRLFSDFTNALPTILSDKITKVR